MWAGRTYAGLPTTFGTAWGRPVSLAGDVGGIWDMPDGARPDQAMGIIVYLHGFGGTMVDGTSRLAGTPRRAARRGNGFYRFSLQGTHTFGGTNRTWNGPNSLLPLNTSFPWLQSTAYIVGDRRTCNGNQYICMIAGTSAASGTGPSGTGAAIADGAGALVWRCIWAGRVHDDAIPDVDFIAGVGRTVGGVFLPMGVIREFALTSGRAIDFSQIWVGGYSTGGGEAYVLLRQHADLFCGAFVLSGVDCTGPTGDHNYAPPTRGCIIVHAHGTADGQVNDEDVPPNASTAAVGSHPGQQTSVQQLIREMGWSGAEVVVDTGAVIDITATAGSETKVWAPTADIVDVKGNNIRARMLQMVGDGHTASLNNEAYRYVTNMFDDNPRTP